MWGVVVIVVLLLAAVFGANPPVIWPARGYSEKEMRIADRILDLEDQAEQDKRAKQAAKK